MSVSGIPIKSLQGEETTIGAHLGKGATVGSVIPTEGAIIPAAVGVDIGRHDHGPHPVRSGRPVR